jgi:hypothetical protein
MTAEERAAIPYPKWMLDENGELKPLEDRVAEMMAYLDAHPVPPECTAEAKDDKLYNRIPLWQRSKAGRMYSNNGQVFVAIYPKRGKWKFGITDLSTNTTEYPVEDYDEEIDAVIAATTEVERRARVETRR